MFDVFLDAYLLQKFRLAQIVHTFCLSSQVLENSHFYYYTSYLVFCPSWYTLYFKRK